MVYLTLVRVPPSRGLPPGRGLPVAVAPVEIPAVLDQAGLMVATGAAALETAPDARWAGPFDGLARNALARDLAAREPGLKVLAPGEPVPPSGARTVHVTIEVFRPDGSGAVTLSATWWLTGPAGQELHRAAFRTVVPGAANSEAEAATMSAALGQLADAIARAL